MSCSAHSLSNKKRSMVKLASLDDSDDLLSIILVRLPARSVFRFRCVSKRWNDIISSPFFIRNYNYRVKTRESCPMVLGHNIKYRNKAPNNVLSVIGLVPPVNEHKIDTSAKLICEFLNSSNDLILCRLYHYHKEYTYSIFNPLTNRSVSLPKPPSLHSSSAVSLICEENPQALSIKYKVFAIEEIKSNYMTMLTFSSDTGKWKSSTLTATSPRSCGLNKLNWRSPFTVNTFIYWYSDGEYIAVYDTNDDTCILQLVEPLSRYYSFYNIGAIRSPGDDSLWLCVRLHETFQLKIWMLPKGEYDSYRRSSTTIPRTKWVVMHDFNYGPLFKTISSQNIEDNKSWRYVIGKWIILKVPHVVLLPCRGRYYICNLENNSFEEVEYNLLGIESVHHFSPYLEPLCLSSYAL